MVGEGGGIGLGGASDGVARMCWIGSRYEDGYGDGYG